MFIKIIFNKILPAKPFIATALPLMDNFLHKIHDKILKILTKSTFSLNCAPFFRP